jgi:hypothetical protein
MPAISAFLIESQLLSQRPSLGLTHPMLDRSRYARRSEDFLSASNCSNYNVQHTEDHDKRYQM